LVFCEKDGTPFRTTNHPFTIGGIITICLFGNRIMIRALTNDTNFSRRVVVNLAAISIMAVPHLATAFIKGSGNCNYLTKSEMKRLSEEVDSGQIEIINYQEILTRL
jgi:hypothetical protein